MMPSAILERIFLFSHGKKGREASAQESASNWDPQLNRNWILQQNHQLGSNSFSSQTSSWDPSLAWLSHGSLVSQADCTAKDPASLSPHRTFPLLFFLYRKSMRRKPPCLLHSSRELTQLWILILNETWAGPSPPLASIPLSVKQEGGTRSFQRRLPL